MATAAQTSAIVLKFSPGSGFTFDAASGGFVVNPAVLAAGAVFTVDAEASSGGKRQFQVTVAGDPAAGWGGDLIRDSGGSRRTELRRHDAAGLDAGRGLRAPGAVGDGQGTWRLGGRGGRRALPLPGAHRRRAAGGDRPSLLVRGAYRAGGRELDGIRVETFEAADGAGRLHIREYTGSAGTTISLATTAVGWTYDAWHWLEVDVADATVRGRICPRARQRRTGR